MILRDLLQEAHEMGAGGMLFRSAWEVVIRSDMLGRLPTQLHTKQPAATRPAPLHWTARLPLTDPTTVGSCMRPLMPATQLTQLQYQAQAAARGHIVCFGHDTVDFGQPIDWHLHPQSGRRWPAHAYWWRSMRSAAHIGDVKLTWEVGRFPHAYDMARAAAFLPDMAPDMAHALGTQIVEFIAANPMPMGVHWFSGQEIAVRLLAWVFALDTLLSRQHTGRGMSALIADAIAGAVTHIERYISYARFAVYNNHLLAEALALYLGGVMLPHLPAAARWRATGHKLLCQAAARQFYADGGYIQQSHNYHRVALQYMLWACVLCRAADDAPHPSWLAAMQRSLDFLLAHLNPEDGTVPNYGNNDGALPSKWQGGSLLDFRPTLQAVSVATRGERIFASGPWDELTVWLYGPLALDTPRRVPRYASVSFAHTGAHVLRGKQPSTYVTFRCGTLRDRFSQIDMLHVDVCWRGQPVLIDAGSYLYNGPADWHAHFAGTASHNTLTVDGRDQMLHFRRFKNVYLTHAKLLDMQDHVDWAACTGEHYGFRRFAGRCVHRRSMLFFKDDMWVVVDTVRGTGHHKARVHWLAGDFSYRYDATAARLTLDTAEGAFSVTTYDAMAIPLPGHVVVGRPTPPRGWQSRYYCQKTPVPSLSVQQAGDTPLTFISVLGAGAAPLTRAADGTFALGDTYHFTCHDGMLRVP